MDIKTCTVCNIEKRINNFYKRYSECKDCNIKRGVRRYLGNEDKISIQQKLYFERNKQKLLQKQNDYRKKIKHRLRRIT